MRIHLAATWASTTVTASKSSTTSPVFNTGARLRVGAIFDMVMELEISGRCGPSGSKLNR